MKISEKVASEFLAAPHKRGGRISLHNRHAGVKEGINYAVRIEVEETFTNRNFTHAVLHALRLGEMITKRKILRTRRNDTRAHLHKLSFTSLLNI